MDQPIVLRTQQRQLQTLFSPDQTGTSFTAPVPSVTMPSGAGVLNLYDLANANPTFWQFIFYGQGTATNTGNARIMGWRQVNLTTNPTALWIPFPLLDLGFVLGTQVGVAGSPVGPDLFATTITATNAWTSAYEITSPGDNRIATVTLDGKGADLIQVQLNTNGSAAAVNGLFTAF